VTHQERIEAENAALKAKLEAIEEAEREQLRADVDQLKSDVRHLKAALGLATPAQGVPVARPDGSGIIKALVDVLRRPAVQQWLAGIAGGGTLIGFFKLFF
jgi:hypothetical protein